MAKKASVSPLLMVLLAACVLLPSTWGAYQVTSTLEQREYEQLLDERAAGQFSVVRSALNELVGVLAALRSFVEINGSVKRWEFDYFVVSQNVADYGIASFEWYPKTSLADAAMLTRKVRAEGQFDFALPVQSETAYMPDLFPLVYRSSFESGYVQPGMDLASLPGLQEHLSMAASSQGLQIAFMDDADDSQPTRLIFGVFNPRVDGVDYASLYGYVSTAIHFADTFEVLLGQQSVQAGLCVEVADVSASASRILYRSGDLAALPCRYDIPAQSIKSMQYMLGGRQLNFSFYDQTIPAFQRWYSLANLTGLALLLVSSLVLLYIYTSRRYALKIERLFSNRTSRLRAVKHEYSQLFMLSVDGIYRASLQGKLLKANPAFAAAFGFADQEDLFARVADISIQLHRSPEAFDNLLDELHNRGRVVNYEWQGVDSSGNPVWLMENAYLVESEHHEAYYEGSISVITERKLAQLKLQHQAERDSLTGLYNRPAFVARIDQHLNEFGPLGCGLCFIDLDRFKAVNDTFGHAVGDELLQQFSKRLEHCFRDGDVIARFGGDEFAVFITDVAGSSALQTLAARVLESMQAAFQFSDGNRFQTTASLGLSLLTADCLNAEDGLRQADMAMYEVKRNGRDSQMFYDDRLNARAQRRILLEAHLREAISDQTMQLHYQPIVCIQTSRVKGAEGLLRWTDPLLGEVSPAEFIPLTEELNLIEPLGDWVLQRAVEDLTGLIQQTGNHELFVNVNVSPKQLISDSILQRVDQLLKQHRLASHNLRLEVTESALYSHEHLAVNQLQQLHQRGIGVYIDDFGTGHSSLERLATYPLTGLKIDRSFVSKLAADNNQAIILRAIVKMSEMLGLTVAAEGIETAQQQRFFAELDCQYGQGYLFYKALSVSDYAAVLSGDDSMEEPAAFSRPLPV